MSFAISTYTMILFVITLPFSLAILFIFEEVNSIVSHSEGGGHVLWPVLFTLFQLNNALMN